MSIHNPAINGQPPSSSNRMADTDRIRQSYKSALSELTFNSKPIITNLTILAQENQAASAVIVKEIEDQLRVNAAGQKLPVLYLIDSICKNVGGVYLSHFGRNMVNVFLDAYTLTEPSTRKSFEKLLHTWKNGMPGGAPVFPRHIIEKIERSVQYIREKTPSNRYQQSSNQQIHVNPNFVAKDPRLSVRDPRNRPQSHSPQIPDKSSQQQQQPQAQPPKPQTQQQQTQQLLTSLQSILPTMTPPVTTTTTTGALQGNAVSQLIGQIQALLPTLPSTDVTSIQQYLSTIAPTASPPISAAPPIVAPTPTPPQAPPVDTAGLLKGLASMGYLSPQPAAAKPPPVTPAAPPTAKTEKPLDLDSFGSFTLDSKDIHHVREGAIELLYAAEPLQCKQCGFRYSKTDKGQAKMDAHLDAHFRQNRKMKERVKRGLSRSWFVSVDEWISGEGGELMSQQAPAFLHDGMGHVPATSEKTAAVTGEQAVDPASHTVIMPNEERKPCLICGERFIDFWNDDEEEWMYKNAVLVDDKIYHATCHADAIKSRTLIDTDIDMTDVNNSLKRGVDQEEFTHIKKPRLD
ncbi:hypothetical protein K501DRAFT_286051 [Backusella circina FSU 941]|nr:hypothetical protein K501DRAFT_286051 [Backusella circina FSU 941]